jgi:hypothetical protein
MGPKRIQELSHWISEDTKYLGDLLLINEQLVGGVISALEYSILVEQLYRRADEAEIDERRREPASDDYARKDQGAA